ncbi:MAG: hypothetical protein Q7W45_17065 [Bacteroidota bacterium]|nr:hypothetical protein [Bacteroidota bacterium]MDP3145274.1 hypothetical protein [Bacteroidota bacterium]
MAYRLICFFIIALFSVSQAQTFEVDQIEQLFRPRIRVESKYILDANFKDTSGVFNQKEINSVFTFPIKTKFKTEVELDLSSLKLKDIINKSVRFKASQTLGVFRLTGRQINIGFDTLPQKNILNATAGLMGLRLSRKYRVQFYSATVTIAEQDKTINNSVPRFSALIGQLHLRGFKRNYFYGIAATYSDGLLIPSPFFGGSEPIGKKFIFNYTLPVQINLQYKDNKKTLVTVGVGFDGYRNGILYLTKRKNLNYYAGLTYANFRYKLSKSLVARVECGYVFYQNLQYTKTDGVPTKFGINSSPYVQIGFSVLFGKTFWEKVFENVIKN